MPDGRSVAYADARPDGRQEARTAPVDGGEPTQLGVFVWNESHHPFEVEPGTGHIISTDGIGGKTTIWMAEYENE